MRIILVAINAKYIHSNLAVYSLQAYAEKYGNRKGYTLEVAEYTINQQPGYILAEIYKRNADLVCFSCYIWNISLVEQITQALSKVSSAAIWLGGPEVTYHSREILVKYPWIKGIIKGEGEKTFLQIITATVQSTTVKDSAVPTVTSQTAIVKTTTSQTDSEQIDSAKTVTVKVEASPTKGLEKIDERYAEIFGISWRTKTGEIVENETACPLSLDEIPFPYTTLAPFQNRIIYYESSRGCPFFCSYCLSSVEPGLRFRSLELVKKELQWFLDQGVSQVKFVDRTFNCDPKRAREIWIYLKDNDNDRTNFHFEIAADLLTEAELELLATIRPGLIQFEIGVQSTNDATLLEIQRRMELVKLKNVVKRLQKGRNIHQHLDLIAGLPYEDLASFKNSFDEVYQLQPNQLQLGFLKVLKGSLIEKKAMEYELQYQEVSPYEVLSTKWLSYEDILLLKGVEEMVEVYYNSRQFEEAMVYLDEKFVRPFVLYESLYQYYEKEGFYGESHSRVSRYEILFTFIKTTLATDELEQFRQKLILDFYGYENVKKRPHFAGVETVSKEEASSLYAQEEQERSHLAGYERYDKRQLRKMTHLERIDGRLLLFDYLHRDPWSGQAKVHVII